MPSFQRVNLQATPESVSRWQNRLKNFDMHEYFGRKQCSVAKGVLATGAIKSVQLFDEKAAVRAYFNSKDIDFEIKVDSHGEIESSISRYGSTSQIMTIAAIMKIMELVRTSSPPTPPKQEEFEETKGDIPEVREPQIPITEKDVLVKLDLSGNQVVMRAFLDNSEKKPVFMQNSNSITVIAGKSKKMALLRLLFYAKKAKFEFSIDNRDYRLRNLRDASDLVCRKFHIWEKYFNITITPKVSLLKRGIIFPAICAKIHDLNGRFIKINWQINTQYGQIDESFINELVKANGRPIFIDETGAVALTNDQIAVIRHILCGGNSKKLEKYMLYVLLNQTHISLDTSDCKLSDLKPDGVKLTLPSFLKNYQRDGVLAMRAIFNAGCHCILADEMGLGKTIQVLSLICSDTNKHQSCSLVVCPASVIPVWQMEIEKFFPNKTSKIADKFYDFSALPDFLICSYTQVHKLNQKLKELNFAYVILDEAQYAKNPRSKTAAACYNISGKFRVAMTGTPIENNLTDIWSIFKFLMPGFLCNYRQFQENIGFQTFRENFKDQISSFIIRRTKQSVAIELPKRNEFEIICNMDDQQRLSYEKIRNNLAEKLRGQSAKNGISRLHVLAAITRLRQASCAQFLLPESLRCDHSRSSQKIDSLMIKLENIAANGRKAVIFSQFLELLEEIKHRASSNIPEAQIYSLTGSTQNRGTVVENFQSSKGFAIILVSLKAGGTGITLCAAEYAFLMEPWWNPAVEEQAIARIHRIGQKNITTIYRMVTKNSIEERMREIQTSKNELFKEFVKTGIGDASVTNFYLKNIESLIY